MNAFSHMLKSIVLSVFAVVAGTLLFIPIYADAKIDETFQVELYEYDEGIWLPKEYKVKDEQGRFATFGRQKDYAGGQIRLSKKGEDRLEILDNGYILDVYWMNCSTPSLFEPLADPEDEVWCPIVTVYNQDDELMFYNGWTMSFLEINKGFKYTMTLADEDGNYIDEQYSAPTMSPKNEDRRMREIPLTRRTWDADNQIARDYDGFEVSEGYMMRPVEEGEYQFRLSTKYDYSEGENGLITAYNEAWGGPEYDEDEDYYRMYTYYVNDVHLYAVAKSFDDGVMLKGLYIPDIIYPAFSDEPLYLCIYPEYDVPEETPVRDKVFYLTKEHKDTLKAEGAKCYVDILRSHPEYVDDEFNATVRFEIMDINQEPTQEELDQKARENAVIKGSTEEPATIENSTEEPTNDADHNTPKGSVDESAKDAGHTMPDGFYYQDLVGDTIPINGKVPVSLLTFEDEHGIHLTLYDANHQIVSSYVGRSMDHVNYKYAYLTEVYVYDAGGCVFDMAGSDTPVSGNLNYINSGEVETDTGMTIGTEYGNTENSEDAGYVDGYEE